MTKLKQTGAIKGMFYPEWLANAVVVNKKSGNWQVCVDFIDLNKVCPKEHFPYASDRLAGGCNCRPSLDELFGCLSGTPSNTTSSWVIRRRQLLSLLLEITTTR